MNVAMFISRPPLNASEEDKEQHPHWRRYTRKYRRKKKIVRNIWVVSGLLMIGAPLGVTAVLGLGTTFLAFIILDETP